MATVLWPATGGYFLEQMLADTFGHDAIRAAREHTLRYVRARGPVPALRVGAQPYGVLPVTSLDLWDDRDGSAVFADVLRRLRQRWREAVPHVPRVDTSAESDAQESLLEVLRGEARSSAWAARPLFGADTFALPGLHRNAPPFAPLQRRREQARRLIGGLGLTWTPRLVDTVFSGRAFLLDAARTPSSAAAAGTGEVLDWLASAPYEALRDETGLPGETPDTLLYLLLRHAVLATYAHVAYRIRLGAGAAGPSELREPVAVDVLDDATPTRGRQPALGLPGVSRPLHEATAADHPEAAALDDMRAALSLLRELDGTELDELLAETLDLFAYRIDAWVTSLATRRLDRLRDSAPRGVELGGFGWLEDVRAAPPAGGGQGGIEPQDDAAEADPRSAGFVHAPSLNQASTAAILRSGALAHREDSGGLFDVDVSSRRVRVAEGLLDGVRAGQPLAALLGYRFERGLHEHGLDVFVAPCRRVAPFGTLAKAEKDADSAEAELVRLRALGHPDLAAAEEAAASSRRRHAELLQQYREAFLFPDAGREALEAVAETRVVDGLALLRLWQDGDLELGAQGLPAAGSQDGTRLTRELDALADAVDAVSDLLVAESVYQLVQGRPDRAGADLDAVSSGATPPPELELVRTPRAGAALTHRVVVLVDPDGSSGPWPDGGTSARAAADPALNAWVAGLLGDPSRAPFVVSFHDRDTEEPVGQTQVHLGQLPVAPLDLLHLTHEAAEGGYPLLEATLGQLLRDAQPAGVPAGADVRLVLDRPVPPASVAARDLLDTAHAAGALLASCRALTDADLARPDQLTTPTVDVAELRARADATEALFRAGVDALSAAVDQPEPEALGAALVRATVLGVSAALPDADEEDKALLARAGSALLDMRAVEVRLDDLAASAPGAGADVRQWSDHELDRVATVLGARLPVLRRLRPDDASGLESSFAASDELLAGEPLAATAWLQDLGRVRPGVERAASALLCAEAAEGAVPSAVVAQRPLPATGRWCALPPEDGAEPPDGALSLVDAGGRGVVGTGPVTGLWVDEWVEVVPAATVATGVAVNVEQPSSQAPQAILLAVHPRSSPRWDVEALEAVLLETLDLARLRAVDPETLQQRTDLDQVLPALYFPLNLNRDTVSTDFRRATEERP